MSLLENINNLDLIYSKSTKRDELYEKVKDISKYVNTEKGFSTLKKDEIINLIENLKKYKKNRHDRIYKFGNKEVITDDYQYSVITAPTEHHIRILAGAGSGKTTTILCRIKYLVDNFILPDRILVLTFNKDACENLKKRIALLFNFELKNKNLYN